MALNTDFSELERLHEGAEAVVYRARRKADQRLVLVKVPRGARPSAEAVARFEREHEITVRAGGEGVVACIDWLPGARPALVLDDIGARSLSEIIEDGALPVSEVLRIGVVIAGVLARLHEDGIVHCDVSPGNVIWNRNSGAVQLIDFGIARRRSRHEVGDEPVSRLQGTLAYMAPEQTGRMNRVVDSRADLFGLGATLYHLLVGRPPFVAEHPIDLVYALIARAEAPAHEVVAEVPRSLSTILGRLLAKSADERYQSAAALRADLLRVADGAADEFVLGADDAPPRLIVSQRLHGREKELAAIEDAFGRIREGRNELILVRGRAGIGKTRLVNEVRPTVVGSRGHFLAGKFDQFHGGVPYSAILVALGRFVAHILSEPKQELEAWGRTLAEAVGDHGALLVEQLPEMGLLIGPQAAAADVPAHEAETRFALLMRRLIGAIANSRRPLVLFLDDLQWADLPSVRLLRQLVTDPRATSTLFIGAYRDREVQPGHPLLGMVTRLRNEGAAVSELDLGALSEVDVMEMVEETLSHAPLAAALGEVVYEKTAGNPFYVCRLLESLDEDRLIKRLAAERRWEIDLDAVRALPYAENVLQFLTARLAALPAETSHVLAVGAVLGYQFRLRDLAAVAEQSLSAAARHLEAALDTAVIERADDSLIVEGLLADDLDASVDPTYCFPHDRVQQAARELLGDDEALAIRISVARLNRRGDLEGARLFDLVEHALAAISLIRADERRDYAELALSAGIRAKNSAAFDASLRYLDGAWSLLDCGDWQGAADLTQKIALEGAEAAYLAGDLERMTAWIGEVVARSKDELAVFRANEIAIQANVAHNELDAAIDRALGVLRLAGIEISRNPSKFDLVRGVMATRWALLRHPPDSLDQLPLCEDPVVLAAMRIQLSIFSATYYAQPELVPFLAFNLTRMSVREGIGPETPNGINAWAFVCCVLGNIEQGYAYGEAAMRINERLADRRLRHRSRHTFLTHIAFWKRHWRECRDSLRDVHRGCWEGGDVEYAAFAAFMTSAMSFMVGDRLEDVAEEAGGFAAAIRSLGNKTALHQLEMVRQTVQCLLGEAPQTTSLRGDIYDEVEMEAVHREANDKVNLFCMGVCSAFLSYVMGQPGQAAAKLRATDQYSDAARSSVYSPFHVGLDGLANIAIVLEGGRRHHRREWRRAGRALKRLRRWSHHAPENHEHRVALLKAEMAREAGDEAEATAAYEAAMDAANRHGWLFDFAIAAERAARFHLDRGRMGIARGYLLDASQHYERWGARAKVRELGAEFPEVLQGGSAPAAAGTVTSVATTSDLAPPDIDATALLRASAAISKEVHVDAVVAALLKLSVENAGASRGVLLLADAEGLRPSAEALAVGEETVVTILDEKLEDYETIPHRVVSYVARTQSDVVIDDARIDPAFSADPYLSATAVRSLLCLPVIHQQRLIAVLCVEHASATNAFSRDRIAPLRALVTQAAISLQNAQLYESLEEKVQQRSRDLIAARQEAERQRDRADDLLVNVLPEPVAAELKRTGRARPVHWPSATVMFTDFANFTTVSSQMSPEALVAELERCFTTFDSIMDEHGVEKLKTIGDSYMAVGGLPIRNDSHPCDVVRAALHVVRAMETPGRDGSMPPFGIRVGVHTGPLVAGVIGKRRFLYDVWGDTVNIASRMESSGEVGRVNISAATYELVKNKFECTPRGKISVKSLGELEMYFVDLEREEKKS